ncbi:dihydrolipoamide dehydrogenase [Halobiforma haloterrestris]|uniref:Dihydrolipoamide dehydrogenase n=1 Tax=Natronobacterium haloterrestre TaxID=148448 RepID=A0A1I1HCY1_NATHA|nr:dihydrolipoyl dehydrogenase [Halobiforma haloterrestris]SFC19838.1 dihydrolipoamide dehydrogenase [Halobiforma haloterrestris]
METHEYDLVVVGGGSGSQVATAAADRGLEAAVVERGPLGGACITRGCVPSKALIHRADVAETVRHAERAGLEASLDLDTVAYGEITDAIHEFVYEKADRQAQSLEDADRISLYRGEGKFVDDRVLEVEPVDATEADRVRRIEGERVVVAVGSRPMTPPIDGLEEVASLTSDDALYLDERPDELVVVGGGYIGAELGYFFGALGTEVSIVGRSDRLVPREDDDVSEQITAALESSCDLYTGHEAAGVEGTDDGVVVTAQAGDGETVDLTADELLVATGRVPSTDALNLEATGIETDDAGYVETDATLETTVDGVWALGDVVGDQPYKHAADYEARVVAANALDLADGERTVDYEAMPHAIFTSPQAASAGATEGELREQGRSYESATVPFDVSPLGTIRDADGLVKVLASPGGEILGCHVVGPEASALIQEVVVAMDRGTGTVADVAETVHVHPALSESLEAAFEELADPEVSTAPDWRDVGE